MNQKTNYPLKETGAYKDFIRQLLFDNEPVRSLIMPSASGTEAALENEWFTKYCLDVPYLDEQIKDERSLLLIECFPVTNSSVRRYFITVTACCHKNLIPLTEETRLAYRNQYGLAGNLVDMITMAVDAALAQESISRNFGIGKLKPAPEKPVVSFIPNNLFYGKTLTYELFEMRKR